MSTNEATLLEWDDDTEETTKVTHLYEELEREQKKARQSIADASGAAKELRVAIRLRPQHAKRSLTPQSFPKTE